MKKSVFYQYVNSGITFEVIKGTKNITDGILKIKFENKKKEEDMSADYLNRQLNLKFITKK